MKKLFVMSIIIFVCIVGISYAFFQKTDNKYKKNEKNISDVSQSLQELNKNFIYKGKYIHPRAIKDLTAWVADREPGPVAIDVAGTFESNRYFGDYENRDGHIFIDLKQEYVEEVGWFGYEHLGRLTNGLHVLRTFDNGGGTGVFQEILLLEAKIDFEYGTDGKRFDKLILQRRGSFGIGDRYTGNIKVDAKINKITIGTDKRNEIKEEFVIQL